MTLDCAGGLSDVTVLAPNVDGSKFKRWGPPADSSAVPLLLFTNEAASGASDSVWVTDGASSSTTCVVGGTAGLQTEAVDGQGSGVAD